MKRQSTFNGHGRGQVRTLAWEYPPGERVVPHRHGWHQLIHAVTGVMTVETPRGHWVVPTHRAVWVPAREVHAIEMSGKVAMRTLYLSPRLKGALPSECRVVPMPPLLRALVLKIIALGGLDRRAHRERHLLEVLVDQIAELPADPLRIERVRDARADQVARRVLEAPGERATLEALARRSGASKRTIERAFERETGMTFGRWRQHVRLVLGLRLLGAGQPVTRVALEVGYDSVSAFIAAFRKAFGTTPGRYLQSEGR
jgi:AraC-like DNA-binding protein/quercetin dioxygenase-like cupin family protein